MFTSEEESVTEICMSATTIIFLQHTRLENSEKILVVLVQNVCVFC